MRREKRETEKLVLSLQLEATRIGEMFKTIGTMLQTKPADVVFEGEAIDVKYSGQSANIFNARDFDGFQIVKLTASLREALKQLESLDREYFKLIG